MKIKLLLYIYILFLILVSVLPINGTCSTINHNYILKIRFDYLLHALIYIPLPMLIGLCSKNIRWWGKDRKVQVNDLNLLIILLVFAGAMEGVQYFIPYRTFNINDLTANILGILIGVILSVLLQITISRRVAEEKL